MGLNEADTLKSSSILIHSHSEQGIYTRGDQHGAEVIQSEIKRRALTWLLKGVNGIMERVLQINSKF